jgi:hypothetical protein
MFDNLNANRTATSDKRAHQKPGVAYSPASVAAEVAKAVAHSHMVQTAEIVELSGPLQLYRAHDGGRNTRRGTVNSTSAGTLGLCWVNRVLIYNLWIAVKDYPLDERKKYFWENLRHSTLVLENWNAMTNLVCMQVPGGNKVLVLQGAGDWKAMLPEKGVIEKDLKDQLRNMATDPPLQFIVPVFKQTWVYPVEEGTPGWPLYPQKR